MDKVADSGSADAGSIPVRGAKFKKEVLNAFQNLFFFV
jgi:hypothetical protein